MQHSNSLTSLNDDICTSQYNLPVCLIILDGFGIAEDSNANAISLANTPNLDKLFADNPWILLDASGEAVGLPEGQMGNSEVGHLNIGAGRVVYQELTRINKACEDGLLDQNEAILAAFQNVKDNEAVLHVMGLLSDGGVHSSNTHLYAILRAAQRNGVKRIFIHCFLDGRDVAPDSALKYIQQLQNEILNIKSEAAKNEGSEIIIASIQGRYFAMDRDNRWDRVELAYNNIVNPTNNTLKDPLDFIKDSYHENVTDEFIIPASFVNRGVHDGDSVIFFNFRPDRAREITRAFTDYEFNFFKRDVAPNIVFVCLTEYDPVIDALVAFPKSFPENVLADCISAAGLKQFHTAETEKYAHVTFFLNGGVEEPKSNEIRLLIDSPKIATYDLQPEMSEPKVAEELVSAILNDVADVYIVNFANCDMVGHTGIVSAAIEAVQAVDSGVGEVLDALRIKSGVAFITADHGNADKMISEDGSSFTAHTTAPVPFIIVDYSDSGLDLVKKRGKLADIAPTLLTAIGITVPPEMTGENLLA